MRWLIALLVVVYTPLVQAQDAPKFSLSPPPNEPVISFEPTEYDVIGLRVGDPLNVAKEILEEKGYNISLDGEKTRRVSIKEGRYKGIYESEPYVDRLVATIEGAGNVSLEMLELRFTSMITGSRLFLLNRSVFYKNNENPEYSTSISALNQKYGINLNPGDRFASSSLASVSGRKDLKSGIDPNNVFADLENPWAVRNNVELDWYLFSEAQRKEASVASMHKFSITIYGSLLHRKDFLEVERKINDFREKYESVSEAPSSFGDGPKL